MTVSRSQMAGGLKESVWKHNNVLSLGVSIASNSPSWKISLVEISLLCVVDLNLCFGTHKMDERI